MQGDAMRILLISPYTLETIWPLLPIGMACVAEATQRAGHDLHLLDLLNERDPEAVLKNTIETFLPELIGISVRFIDDQTRGNTAFLIDQAKAVVSLCRRFSEAPIVLGGSGYTMYPESVLAYLGADMGIQGEGEGVFPDLADRIQKGADLSGLPGLYLPGQGSQGERIFNENLDAFPLPSPRLWETIAQKDQETWIPIRSRWGCPMNCSYCSTAFIEGRKLRQRSPDRVVKEIARTADAGFHQFHFTDNNFNVTPQYAGELCRLLIAEELNITWQGIIYARNVEEPLVRDMARSGCREVVLGFESGCERILQAMNKKFNPEQIRKASALFAEHGIFRRGTLLLGGPGETKASVEESMAFADSLDLDALHICIGIRIYPNTDLAEIARNEGLISPEDDLLIPKFYLARGLEEWIQERIRILVAERPDRFTRGKPDNQGKE